MRPKLSEVALLIGATHVNSDVTLGRVHTDTRTLQPGDCFLALEGINFDGHEFIADAAAKGAAALVVAKPVNSDLPTLLVDDTEQALTKIGGVMRDRFHGQLVALTGSCGKTTVKTLTALIMAQCGQVLATEGNKNNELGTPLMLSRLDDGYDYAVIELGANHQGEIERMVEVTKPHTALINNAHPVHLDGFGSIDGVAKGKGEILGGLAEGGIAVLPQDDVYLSYWRKQCIDKRVLTFGETAAADFYASDIVHNACGTQFTLHVLGDSVAEVTLPLLGKHNLLNAVAACALAYTLGAKTDAMVAGLAQAEPVPGRLVASAGPNGSILIDDTYNANPIAAQAAIDVLCGYNAPQKWLVLGDMGELGNNEREWHRLVGVNAKKSGVTKLFSVGHLASEAAEAFGDGASHYDSKDELITALQQSLNKDVVLLAKGSRSARMEAIIDGLGKELAC